MVLIPLNFGSADEEEIHVEMSKEVSVTEEMTKKISKKNSIDKSTNILEEKDDLSGCPGSESGPVVRGSRL